MQNPLPSASRFLKARTKGNLDVKPVTVTNHSTFHPFNHSTNYPSRLMPHSSRKCAFTLAELLITIGIIGVVAALTVPILISKYNEMVTVTQLKKTYAELQQAIKLSEAQNGDFRDWDYTVSSEFGKKYIMPYLAKDYKQLSRECFDGSYIWRKPNGDRASVATEIWQPRYQYADKIILIEPLKNGERKYVNIFIDINGKKGKSIMGKDVFMFTLFNYTYAPIQNCKTADRYGLYQGSCAAYHGAYCGTLDEMLGTEIRGGCNINGNGNSCGLAIEKNGWKVPKGYPIKF